MSDTPIAFVPCSPRNVLSRPSVIHPVHRTQRGPLRVALGHPTPCQPRSQDASSRQLIYESTQKITPTSSYKYKNERTESISASTLEKGSMSIQESIRTCSYSLAAFLTVYILRTPTFATVTSSTPSTPQASVPSAPSAPSQLPTPKLPTDVDPSATQDAINLGAQDDLFSKILVNVVFGLLVYVTISTIIVTANKYIKRQNRENNKKWIEARLNGESFPSNKFFDLMKDTSLPDDLPTKLLVPYGEEAPPPRSRKKAAQKKDSASEPPQDSGNREMRREMKKSRNRDREPDKKVVEGRERASAKKEASTQRALRKAAADARRKKNKK